MQSRLHEVKVFDPELYDLVCRERERQETTLELIASESIQSPQMLELSGCVFNNKTAVGRMGDQHLAGCALVDELMKLTADRACELYGAEHANVQPYSGFTANLSVYAACLNIKDRVLSMSPDHGGHATHGSARHIVSQMYDFSHYTVNEHTQLIDYDDLEQKALRLRPRLIIAGGSTYSQYIDFERIADIAKRVDAYFLADMAHYTGLVAARLMPSPVPYADFVTGSTSKTICGPRSGFILCKKKWADKLDTGVYPRVIASMHLQGMAGMAHAFYFAKTPEFRALMEKTVENAQALCGYLQQRGFSIVTNGTKCHLLLIDMRDRGIDAKTITQALQRAGVSVNPVIIPYDPSPERNGIRVGCTVSAQRGMGAEQMEIIAEIIDRVSRCPDDETVIGECAENVKKLTRQFPLYGFYDAMTQSKERENS